MIILNIPLFKGLTLEQIEDMKNKHCMTEKKYKKNSFIFRAGDIVHEIGIVLEGSINIEMIDMWDNKSILSNIDVGQIFAESYALCNEPMMVDAVATKDSTILRLNMRQIFAPINNSASWYNTFTYNLLVLSTRKNLTLSTRIFCTSSKSVRGRVLTYLSNQSIKHNNTEFQIPFNRQQMADYLNLDRSALSKELGKMQDEGIITFNKNSFKLNINYDSEF